MKRLALGHSIVTGISRLPNNICWFEIGWQGVQEPRTLLSKNEVNVVFRKVPPNRGSVSQTLTLTSYIANQARGF